MEDFAASLGDIGRGVGPYFGAAFLVIVFIWVQFLVRWRDEKRELGLAGDALARLLDQLEQSAGSLHGALRDRFEGRCCTAFADQAQFEAWFEAHIHTSGKRHVGTLFRNYLWGVLSSTRPYLRAFDNRVNLTGVRNELKRYRYHRWLNFGLANTAVSLGILGTVTGLWAGFNQIDFAAADIASVMKEVMASMSQALHTTAVGVLVSMPIVISGLKMERQLEELFGMVHEVHNALVATLRQFDSEVAAHGVR